MNLGHAHATMGQNCTLGARALTLGDLALLTVQLLASLDAPWPTGYSVWSGEILIPAGTLLVSTVGMISIWLGWRKERRGSREYTLKIQQLEMQVAELRTKNSSTTPPVAP